MRRIEGWGGIMLCRCWRAGEFLSCVYYDMMFEWRKILASDCIHNWRELKNDDSSLIVSN